MFNEQQREELKEIILKLVSESPTGIRFGNIVWEICYKTADIFITEKYPENLVRSILWHLIEREKLNIDNKNIITLGKS